MLIPSERKKELAWILAITFVPLLLFAQKPFHIDDSAFLEIAENILQHPWDPFHGKVALVDHDYEIFKLLGKTPNTFESMSHPPLVPYLMAAVIKLSGGVDEFVLHLAFLIFPIMAALSAFYIAIRFCDAPLLAVLLLVTCPIFMVNAQNLMTDVPALALTLCSLAVFVYAVDRQKTSFAVISGILAGLSALTRYPGLITPLLLVAYSVISRKGFRLSILAAAISIFIFGIWVGQNIAVYSTPHIWASYQFYKDFYADHSFGFQDSVVKALSNFAAVGGCAFVPIMFLFFFRKKKFSIAFGISVAVSAVLLLWLKTRTDILADYTTLQVVTLFCFFLAGVFVVAEPVHIVLRAFKEPNTQSNRQQSFKFLAVWLLLTLIPTLFLLPFGTGRYMLPVLFPLILILTIAPAENFRPGRKALPAIIAVTFVVGLVLSWTDFEFALSYKVFPQTIRETYRKDKLWFIGEWGFRYYMKQKGGVYLLSEDNTPSSGDIIIRPEIAGLHRMGEPVSRRCLEYDPFLVFTLNPVRVMNYEAKAGFYGHGFGLLPFSHSEGPLERFEICRIFDQ